MSSLTELQSRLKELSTTLANIHPLVARLQNFTTVIGQGDEARLELGTEIHTLLKGAEDQLELLRVEVEGLEAGPESRRKGLNNEKESERERVVALAGRLTEELKRTRRDFRNAQLQAKRNAETARRKERELLFSRSQSADRQTQQPAEKLTQDEIVKNASNDVTAALRRTHQLMQAELSRKQSTAALSSLSESYTDLDSLITSSRNLLSSLLRSQKSDTWYLETAFYILVGTITWLIFRRILYGPLWWLVWLPVRMLARFTFTILGVVGITSGRAIQASASATAVTQSVQETPVVVQKVEPTIQSAGQEAVWDQVPVTDETEEDRLIDQIGELVDEIEQQEETNIDDISPEERQRQAELPRNPKKRMFEAPEVTHQRDEL
ncbi:putative protein transport membrane glycoprotein Sec20 [Aspergillus saccharolyticus JOP 1030-1]|uniref:Sec20 domain protein n=1 Tax=Aspergillus saccharolyticus JOP 1030-1 TaxID=1450539 RepID=A0A318ZUC9_9EURO|nr:Sec20 domain protein [Aspergillus saccharolyticus JOP 1030-1]PYH47933.1 Sec20 domain protein [Aspergillus saccharolyticus JOP 1030-1]